MTTTMIPESAPFTEEQRAWLNGFLTGLMGMPPAGTSLPAGLLEQSTQSGLATAEEEDLDSAPWHDASLPIVDRMELAEGKPLPHKLMAAMAQLDCGSCGYVCQTYSAAIAAGEESNLGLCSPGGKETKQMLKKLVKESAGAASTGPASPESASPGRGSNGTGASHPANGKANGFSRQNPFEAKLLEARPLNREGSAKDTRHVAIDLENSGLSYEVGDALGVYPCNCDELVQAVIRTLGADAHATVTTPLGNKKSLRDALREDCCLKDPEDELVELLIERCQSGPSQETLKSILNDGPPDGLDVFELMQMAEGARISPTELIETLGPLNPRLYSIASSMKAVGNQVHLTVGRVSYEREGRVRKGVASTFLADRLHQGDRLKVFVQPNHGGFTVPSDPSQPMIMVGPGTGIAPFIAFLQERLQTQAPGKNWLFFGDQRSAFDYLYEEQLTQWQTNGLLTRLDTAFSRDGANKVYVQDRMRENASEVFRWLEEGAHFYVCGDASRMAADVDRALREIIAEQGSLSASQADAYIKNLADNKRYVRDVY